MLGMHWIGEAHGCPSKTLTYAHVAHALSELPRVLGLTAVSDPVLHHHPDGSVAGIILLAESHFSLHCNPAQGWLHADLFSCVVFEPVAARRWLEQKFGVQDWTEKVLQRGLSH